MGAIGHLMKETGIEEEKYKEQEDDCSLSSWEKDDNLKTVNWEKQVSINAGDKSNYIVTKEEQATAQYWLQAILKQSNGTLNFKLYKNQGNLKSIGPG